MQKRVAYVGLDQRYFKALQQEFEDLYGEKDNFTFIEFWEDSDGSYKKFLRELVKDAPDVLFIDYSVKFEDMLHLGLLVRNFVVSREVIVVGLLNPLEKDLERRGKLRQIIQSGVRINMVKDGGNLHDPVYAACYAKWPQDVKGPTFVKVKKREGIEGKIGEVMRVSMISMDEFLVETNLNFSTGEIIELETEIPESVLPSKQFLVKDIQKGHTFYRKLHRIRLVPMYLDLIDESSIEDPEELEEKKKARFDKIHTSVRLHLESWIFRQMSESKRKDVKCLVIDRDFKILEQADQWIGDYDYSIRLQTCFDPKDKLLSLYRPHLIVWEMEDVPEVIGEDVEDQGANKGPQSIETRNYNSLESLISLCQGLEAGDETTIIVFGAKGMDSKDLREATGHNLVVASEEKFCFASMNKMLQLIQKRVIGQIKAEETRRIKEEFAQLEAARQQKLRQEMLERKAKAKSGKIEYKKGKADRETPTYINPESPRYYVDKASEYSSAVYWESIKIFTFDEVQLDFECERTLPNWSAFIMKEPARISLLICPQKQSNPYNGQRNMYFALANGMELEEKNKLRAFLIRNKS